LLTHLIKSRYATLSIAINSNVDDVNEQCRGINIRTCRS